MLSATRAALTPAISEGRIIVASSAREVERTVARWRGLGAQNLAHDLECAASPTVRNGSGLHPHLGTIRLAQFAVADGGRGRAEALVIDAWRLDPSPALALVADPRWPTIIHFSAMETRWLGYRFGLAVESLIDTHHAAHLIHEQRLAAGDWEPRIESDLCRALAGKGPSCALGVVCERELSYKMDKSQQNSTWDAVKLSFAQLHYAGLDVLSLLDLWAVFEPLLSAEDRLQMTAQAAERNATALKGGPKGCESGRALRMIAACRELHELRAVERSIPYMRLHHTNRPALSAAIAARHAQLSRGAGIERTERLAPSPWRQPF